jgi:Anti-sigma factor NepR
MIIKKALAMASDAHGGPGSRGLEPKLGRDGRREIGRALGAMYDDVVRQGVPPHIVEILDGLDRPARGGLDPSAA